MSHTKRPNSLPMKTVSVVLWNQVSFEFDTPGVHPILFILQLNFYYYCVFCCCLQDYFSWKLVQKRESVTWDSWISFSCFVLFQDIFFLTHISFSYSGDSVEDVFIETAKKIYQNIQDGKWVFLSYHFFFLLLFWKSFTSILGLVSRDLNMRRFSCT